MGVILLVHIAVVCQVFFRLVSCTYTYFAVYNKQTKSKHPRQFVHSDWSRGQNVAMFKSKAQCLNIGMALICAQLLYKLLASMRCAQIVQRQWHFQKVLLSFPDFKQKIILFYKWEENGRLKPCRVVDVCKGQSRNHTTTTTATTLPFFKRPSKTSLLTLHNEDA